MTSKEAIQELYNEREYLLGEKVNNKTKNWHNDIKHYDNINHCLLTIREDLERLEKENKELKERYKHRAEISNDLCKAVKQYEKAFDIVTYKSVNILILKYCIAKGGGVETYNLHYKTEEQITQEEYELLKEVFGND